ncbi:MAG: hypothetical protein WAK96_10175, partial [Desulfobaccales bacterium]
MRRPTLALLLIVLASAGCSYIMPPQKIPMDRRNYLDAVSTSWKEQLLNNLVKLRYGDTLTCLEMTSVTTSYELDAGLTANYPVAWNPLHTTNPSQSWSTGWRNTVTLGGSAGYQDKPSITYVPMKGDELARTMLDPIPPSKFLQSIQAGWPSAYVLSCCLKSINDLGNRSASGNIEEDTGFFELVQIVTNLEKNGVIRITVKNAVEPKVTKVPQEYTVTLKDERQGTGSKPVMTLPVKAGTETKKGKSTEGGTDKNKVEKDTSIGLLVLDTDRAKHGKVIEKEVKAFKKLLWPNSAPLDNEYKLYHNKCLCCHEAKDGNTGLPSISSYFNPAASNDPKFWVEDVDQKITRAVTKGCRMSKITPSDLKAITTFIEDTFGKYKLYKIYDGNQEIPLDPGCDKIVLQTRSIWQVLYMLSMFIKVPPEDTKDLVHPRAISSKLPGQWLNASEKTRWPVVDEDKIPFKIEYGKELPKDCLVAIQKRGYWFYIDDTDLTSKLVFSYIAGILS